LVYSLSFHISKPGGLTVSCYSSNLPVLRLPEIAAIREQVTQVLRFQRLFRLCFLCQYLPVLQHLQDFYPHLLLQISLKSKSHSA
jgi:hypothetical protein